MEHMGLTMGLFGSNEIRKKWPFLRVNDLLGGTFTEDHGCAGPHGVPQECVKGTRRFGGLLKEGTEVSRIETKDHRLHAVKTTKGESINIYYGVNVAGHYAAHVAKMAGVNLRSPF
jgi:L-2-hydroxyglutarate oxidase LhgO